MDYYPLFLKIEDRTCVVIGGGAVAARKVAMLRRAGAKLATTTVTDSPSFITFRALRGGGFDIIEAALFQALIATGNVRPADLPNAKRLGRTLCGRPDQELLEPEGGRERHEGVASGGVGGGVLLAIVGLIKQAMSK